MKKRLVAALMASTLLTGTAFAQGQEGPKGDDGFGPKKHQRAGEHCKKGKRGHHGKRGGHHRGHKGHGKHGGKGFEGAKTNPMKMFRKLDLTDAQKTQVKTIFDELKPASAKQDNREAMMKAHQEKMAARRALIEAKTFDAEAAKAMAKESADKMTERFVKMAEAEHKAWQVLTSEQKTRAKDMMKKRMEKRQARKEKRDNLLSSTTPQQ